MNEKIDLTKILKDCPKGWKLYSTIYGDVEFIEVSSDPPILLHERDDEWHYEQIKNHRYPIKLMSCSGEYSVSREGKYKYNVGECTLFPSKDQRDWNKFSAPWYKKLIKSKFNVGQYITDGYVVGKITSIEYEYQCYKILDFMGGASITIPFTLQDNYHLWTITDAKDGDVLALSWLEDKNLWEKIIIFKKYHSEGVGLYIMPCVEGYGNTFKNGKIAFTDEKVPYYSKSWTCNLHPATKEQRDLLFQKIKEAGYKLEAKTKTLYKEAKTKTLYKDTKTKTLYKVEPKFKVGDKIVNVPMKSMSGPWTQATISEITNDKYIFTDGSYMRISDQDHWELNKFNPKTLQPFDRVLVRDYNDDKWVCSIFSHIEPEDSFHYECILELNCKYCIPYNEDTKHLVGTKDEAPEFYRYWED